jgi:hypothetical protein
MDMEAIIVANQEDVKRWMKEALDDYFKEGRADTNNQLFGEPLLSRKEIVKHLDGISLVTLHAWVKEGLPCHKQGGRVYFLKSEVVDYIKKKRLQTG